MFLVLISYYSYLHKHVNETAELLTKKLSCVYLDNSNAESPHSTY